MEEPSERLRVVCMGKLDAGEEYGEEQGLLCFCDCGIGVIE